MKEVCQFSERIILEILGELKIEAEKRIIYFNVVIYKYQRSTKFNKRRV